MISKNAHDLKNSFNTKFENFLPTDKQRLLERFLFDDEVVNIVKDVIFRCPKNNLQNELENKNIIQKKSNNNTLHFSGIESESKKFGNIPSLKKAKKVLEALPLMYRTKLNGVNYNSFKKI